MFKSRHVVIIAFTAGLFLRVFHLLWINHNLPFGLGGLFYAFAEQILDNNYAWPERIPHYTMGGIPFAYPPLAFYLEALIIDLFSPAKFALVNSLPVIFSLLSLPAFYLLARKLYDDERNRAYALLAYATMPAAYMQLIEAGGLAEALGSLILMLFGLFLVRLYKHNRNRDAVWAGLFLGGCVMASPGSAYAALPAILIFLGSAYIARRHTFLDMLRWAILACLIGVAVASPYLLVVIHEHGIQQFMEPFGAEHRDTFSFYTLRQMLKFEVAGEGYSILWNALILVGLLGAAVKRQWALIACFLLFYIIPREGVWLVSLPAAFLITTAVDYLTPMYGKHYWLTSVLVAVLSFTVLLSSLLLIENKFQRGDVITWREMNALEWASQHTAPDANLIVLASTAAIEWSPQITERTVLNVKYGAEWEPDEREKIVTLNAELFACFELDCIRQQIAVFGYYESRVYILLDKNRSKVLTHLFEVAPDDFDIVYDQDDVLIGTLHLQ